MKKLLALLLSVVMVLSVFAACDSNSDDDEDSAASSYKTPIDNYIKVMTGKASKATLKGMYPKEILEANDIDIDEYWDDYQDSKDDLIDEMEDEYGKNVRVTYKVIDKTEVDEEELEELAANLEENYGISASKVKKGYELEVEMTVKGSADSDTEETTYTVVQIGSQWYLSYFLF